MKTIGERIKEGLNLRNMKQADLVEKTKINKGSLSSYISGKYAPKQNNIYLIAEALNVNEAWLMGYDVPIERTNNITNSNHTFTKEEKNLIEDLRKLNDIGKNKVYTYTKDLIDNPKFTSINTITKDEISATLCVTTEKEPYLFAAHNDGIDEETNKANIEKIKAFYNNNLKGKK